MCCSIKRVIASVCGSKLNPRTASGLDGLKPFLCPKAVGGDVPFLRSLFEPTARFQWEWFWGAGDFSLSWCPSPTVC